MPCIPAEPFLLPVSPNLTDAWEARLPLRCTPVALTSYTAVLPFSTRHSALREADVSTDSDVFPWQLSFHFLCCMQFDNRPHTGKCVGRFQSFFWQPVKIISLQNRFLKRNNRKVYIWCLHLCCFLWYSGHDFCGVVTLRTDSFPCCDGHHLQICYSRESVWKHFHHQQDTFSL